MKNTKASTLSLTQIFFEFKRLVSNHEMGKGVAIFWLCLIILSLLGSIQTGKNVILFTEGDIATQNVIANKDLYIEDSNATKQKIDRALLVQPAVYDLDINKINDFKFNVQELMREVAAISKFKYNIESFVSSYNSQFGTNLSIADFKNLDDVDVHNYIVSAALPWLESRLKQGVVPDFKNINLGTAGIIVRDTITGSENFRLDNGTVTDIRTLMQDFAQVLRGQNLSPEIRESIVAVIFPIIPPSLYLNKDLTDIRNSAIIAAIEPVFYTIKKGELVVRQGEVVTREQQLIMQNILETTPKIIDPQLFVGLLLLSSLLSIGLFVSPSGTIGTKLAQKEETFIGLLILFFGIMAFGLQIFIFSLLNSHLSANLVFIFPAAAASGLGTLIFSAKRYGVISLLVSFFATIILKGSVALFLFYFGSSLFNTWLVLHAYNRQDMVRSAVPLFIFTCFLGFATALITGIALSDFAILFISFVGNVVLTITLIFALSPILEMSFGFTTRFRLMELMNLEQPLLQDLMTTIPGTYHHSLIVSNMVESAAKIVGANSLLCKVGALYHDIGKLAYPEYYIENQFNVANKHDNLSTAMSSLIIQSHVKKGIELAEENKLGKEIIDMISQHHGNRIIRFFYQKAIDNGENPREEDYSYPGPRPRSTEAALVMIADAIEASSRTLLEPSPARIRTHVDNIIRSIFEEGQLDESDLTFKDLDRIADSFTRILIGLFHQRIIYPDKKEKAGQTSGNSN